MLGSLEIEDTSWCISYVVVAEIIESPAISNVFRKNQIAVA